MTRDGLRGALSHGNVRAFLRVIREGESRQADDAYRLENGGRVLPEYPAEHPSKGLKSPPGKAFGAYQFLASTWEGLVRQYGFESMSPQNQDEAAVALILERRGALDAILAGRLDEACRLLNRVWTSLPGGSEENAATKRARETYEKWGGALFNPDSLETEHYGDTPMAPIILPLLQIAAQFLPQLAEKFGSGSEVANRNLAAGKVLAEAITTATNSPNLQAAVEKMQSDPEAVKAAKVAVAQEWPELFEIGGGIKAAREAAESQSGDWRKLVFSLPFVGIILFTPAIWAVVAASVFKAPWLLEMDPQLRGTVIGFVMGTLAGSICGYIFGSSMTKTPAQPSKG